MSPWVEIPLLIFVILGIALGFFGLFLVFFPGLTVIWISIFVWGIADLFNYHAGPQKFTFTIITFVFITLLMIVGNILDNILMFGRAKSKGASWWGIVLSVLGMIAIGILLTPVAGLAAALIILFFVEFMRVKDFGKAFRTAKGMVMGCGLAVVARLGIATLMIILFVLWHFLLD